MSSPRVGTTLSSKSESIHNTYLFAKNQFAVSKEQIIQVLVSKHIHNFLITCPGWRMWTCSCAKSRYPTKISNMDSSQGNWNIAIRVWFFG